MERDSFFDTSTIIHYADYSPKYEHLIAKRCNTYISNKKGKFLICFFVLVKEIPQVVRKRGIIHKEVFKKIKDKEYLLGSTWPGKELSKNDLQYTSKIYEAYKDLKVDEVSRIFLSERTIWEMKIDLFLKTKIDAQVMPLKEIDEELVKILNESIENYADCKVLASALQSQKERDIFLFVIADKHVDPNTYDFLKGEPRLEKYKFPELKNLCFED